MMARKTNLIGLLLASSVALTACSGQQLDHTTIKNQEASISAEVLKSNFKETALAHRKGGEISSNSLESKLRNKVRAELKLDFNYLANAPKDELLTKLNEEDRRLAHFKHATSIGSDLEQLLALAPALPVLEQRKAIQVALQARFKEQPELTNSKMAELMDLQINRLFDGFAINVDALTPEAENYEDLLIQELKSEGLNISARRPSLILEYFIDTYTNQQDIELVADFEFKDRNAQTFHTLSSSTTYLSTGGESAQKDAFSLLVDEISEQLLEKVTKRINNVNSVK